MVSEKGTHERNIRLVRSTARSSATQGSFPLSVASGAIESWASTGERSSTAPTAVASLISRSERTLGHTGEFQPEWPHKYTGTQPPTERVVHPTVAHQRRVHDGHGIAGALLPQNLELCPPGPYSRFAAATTTIHRSQ